MKSARQGFTLVELLVVISIIAILSVIGITVFSGVQKQARDAKRRADLRAIGQALEIYKSINGSYPHGVYANSSDTNDPWIVGLNSNYMQTMPKDPKNTGGHPEANPPGFTYSYYAAGYNGATADDIGSWFMLIA